MNEMVNDIKKSDRFIPYYFVLFFLVVAAVNSVFVYIAVSTYTGVVTENPYEAGLAYNKTLDNANAQKSLNIKHIASFKDGKITWELYDTKGAPINNANVKANFVREVSAGYDFNSELKQVGNGIYAAEITPPLSGAWTAKLEATWNNNNQKYQTTYRFVTK